MQRRQIQTERLSQSILEAGSGPLVVLVHGFPELAISWTAQVQALAEAGYRAVAPDMRGYGGTDKPDGVEAYRMAELVGDVVDLVHALGETQAVVVGHDFGSAVAWNCALQRPDVFRAVVGLSVPFAPRSLRAPPIAALKAIGQRIGQELYIVSFQAPDAHHPFDSDPRGSLRKAFWSYDGATPAGQRSTGWLPPGVPMLDTISDEATLPPWLTPEHFDLYVQAFSAGGFAGPVNWYRNLDRNWHDTETLQDKTIDQPSLFIVGEFDPVRLYSGKQEEAQGQWLTGLRGQIVVPDAGHWIQQERPEAVNTALVAFLRDL